MRIRIYDYKSTIPFYFIQTLWIDFILLFYKFSYCSFIYICICVYIYIYLKFQSFNLVEFKLSPFYFNLRLWGLILYLYICCYFFITRFLLLSILRYFSHKLLLDLNSSGTNLKSKQMTVLLCIFLIS